MANLDGFLTEEELNYLTENSLEDTPNNAITEIKYELTKEEQEVKKKAAEVLRYAITLIKN